MILEDRGVPRETFIRLLRAAVADAQLVDNSLSDCHKFVASHSFGRAYYLPWILEQLAERGAEIVQSGSGLSKKINIDSKFLKGLRNIARMQALKEIKHDARILIPDSYLLVGVADEGPAYVADPSRPEFTDESTYCLGENHIYGMPSHSFHIHRVALNLLSESMYSAPRRREAYLDIWSLLNMEEPTRSFRRWYLTC